MRRLRKTSKPLSRKFLPRSVPDAPRPSRRSASSARLQAVEALGARALSASGLGAWAWDLATDVVACSPDLEVLWGLTPGTFGGTSEAVREAVHPDDRPAFTEAARRTLETGQDHHVFYRTLRPDGAVRWIEAKGQVVRDAAGQVCGMTGVSMDVTARMDAEEEAHARESRLQALADNVPVLIARIDTGRRYVFANRAYEDVLGIPVAQVVGRTMADVLGEAAYETIRPYVDRALAGEPVQYDAMLPYRTVGARFVHGAYAPERGPNGEVTGFLLSAVDISARKQAEDATRRLALIVENSHEAIISTDLEGTVLSWNRGAERLYGWTDGEAVGRSIRLVFPPEAPVAPPCLPDARTWSEGALEYEAVRVCKDGTRRAVSVTVSPFRDGDGQTIGDIAIVRDITAQKEAERARQALEAEHARLLDETERLLAQTEALLASATERADRDPLTGLMNHRAFHEKLEEEAERAGREGTFLAVAMLDLDGFKFFNDAYGHPVGDDALRQVADALRRLCRPYDTVARFGGDEFAVLMPGVGRDETEVVAARMAHGLEGGSGLQLVADLLTNCLISPAPALSRDQKSSIHGRCSN